MAEIKAFKSLRFTEKAGSINELVCPPYDIVSEAERQEYLARNPHNIIRLELPRDGENPYATAGETLNNWLRDDILAPDDTPGLYIYEMEFTAYGERLRVKGLTCRVRLEPFDKGIVLPHEETLSKAKDDRFNLMCATGCNFSAIYSLYSDEKREIDAIIQRLSVGAPDTEFETPDGIVHRLWCVYDKNDIAALEAAFEDKKLYIADGHHRYETALNYQKHMHEQGKGGADYCMMTLVGMEHDGLVVFPTHRIISGLENFNAEKLLSACEEYFDITDAPEADEMQDILRKEDGKKRINFLAKGIAKLLTLKDISVMDKFLPNASKAYRQLDVNVLHVLILERILGIDRENMQNQKNLTYTRDPVEAAKAVDSGSDCAFLINPTRVDEVAGVAAAGEKMPQKSTYFYPKLITGLFMNKIDA